MIKQNFISIESLCLHYDIEISLVDALNNLQLIHVEVIEDAPYVHQDQIGDLEKIIRLHRELNVNLEGIDVVFNLLEKERKLRNELNALKNRLRLYEND